MIKVIEKKGALKAFYYLMAVDGVTPVEMGCFEEIGTELLGADFVGVKNDILSACQSVTESVTSDDEYYDVIQEALDNALNEEVFDIEEGVTPRLLLWNMLTLAHSDLSYVEEENRLISHVARVLNIDKSVFTEMKQLMSAISSVQTEKATLDNSSRPYSEIRPLIDEVEKRKQTIVEAATALIADDYTLEISDNKESKDNAILSTGKKIGANVAPVMKNLGSKVATNASGVAEGAGKFFTKIKDATKKNIEKKDEEK